MAIRYLSIPTLWISLTLLFISPASQAWHLPLWEFGFGAGVIQAPHYRGSSTVKRYWLPVPYIAYRGDWLKIDEDGLRSPVLKKDDLRIDISIAGNVPVPDVADGARADMPGLDPIGEIGPSVELRLWQSSSRYPELWIKLPFRAVLSVGNPVIDHQGWAFAPYLELTHKQRELDQAALWKLNLSLGPIFADNKYHDYFYSVDPQYSNPDRETYDADAGYSGSRVTFTASRNSRQWFIGFLARYDNLNGATFIDSPLIETKHYFTVGLAFAWIFAASEQMIPH